MTDFELQFRGALWRYLKREGHDVHRITDYWLYTSREYGMTFVVDFVDNSGMIDAARFHHFTLDRFLEEL